MGRRKREPMSEGKRNIITGLLQEYDIKTAKDIEDALKDLMSGTIQEMLEAEIEVPQDRDGSFEPKVVQKRQKDISGIEQKIISLYAKGMTTRRISETIEDI